MIESGRRVFAKVVTWRILLSISHFVNALIVTGSWVMGLQVVGLTTIFATIVYWLHEQCWARSAWGRNESDKITFNDKWSRSGIKLFTWRIVITITNFSIVYFVSGSIQAGVAFMTIATVINIVLYWLHERAWNQVVWGKVVKHDLE
jgi:uncharacterized membrane protein